MNEDFINELVQLNEEEVYKMTRERIDSGEDPLNILSDVRIAMTKIGEQFDCKEYFIPELIMAGEILKEVTEIVKPNLTEGPKFEHIGKAVIGTVKGDIHNVGKDLVAFMFETKGVEVFDLGVDVPAQTFVEKIKEVEPEIVALSGLLTLAYDSMKDTIQAITEAGLRDKVKIMIGGGLIDEDVVKYVGADATKMLAVEAAGLAREWLGGE